MKKLLKFVGKILAIPFEIVVTTIKICLLPLIFIRELLLGNIKDLEKRSKFGKNMWDFCIKRYKEDKPFFFNQTITYGDDKISYSLTNSNLYRDNELVKINNIFSKCHHGIKK